MPSTLLTVLGVLLSYTTLVSSLGSTCSAPLGAGTAAPSGLSSCCYSSGIVFTPVTIDPYWMQNIKHQGTAAFNADPSGYQVFRNVKDFGAKGLYPLCTKRDLLSHFRLSRMYQLVTQGSRTQQKTVSSRPNSTMTLQKFSRLRGCGNDWSPPWT